MNKKVSFIRGTTTKTELQNLFDVLHSTHLISPSEKLADGLRQKKKILQFLPICYSRTSDLLLYGALITLDFDENPLEFPNLYTTTRRHGPELS